MLPGTVRTGATFADACAEYLRYVESELDRKPSTVTSAAANRTLIGVLLRTASFSVPLMVIVQATVAKNKVFIAKTGSTGVTIAANTTYKLVVTVETPHVPGSLPVITVYLDGVSVCTYTLTAPELVIYPETAPDGIMAYNGASGADLVGRRYRVFHRREVVPRPTRIARSAAILSGIASRRSCTWTLGVGLAVAPRQSHRSRPGVPTSHAKPRRPSRRAPATRRMQ
jgi:hypothetical protein